jgi:hypothetical protein
MGNFDKFDEELKKLGQKVFPEKYCNEPSNLLDWFIKIEYLTMSKKASKRVD